MAVGYVLLAFLRTDLCEGFHWINSSQLLDAVAVGQITPGPLFTLGNFHWIHFGRSARSPGGYDRNFLCPGLYWLL